MTNGKRIATFTRGDIWLLAYRFRFIISLPRPCARCVSYG